MAPFLHSPMNLAFPEKRYTKRGMLRHKLSLVSNAVELNGITTVGVDAGQLRRTIVALACTAPNSIRAIEEQSPLIYPGAEPATVIFRA